MTNPNPSYAIVSGSGDSFYHAVFVETNLDTHLVLAVSDTETVSDLKNKIVQEHPILFPNYGEIRVNAVKVKRGGHFYCLCDSIPVSTAFIGKRKNWFLSVESSSSMETKIGDQLTPLAMYPPNYKGDLKIAPHQRSVIDSEFPSNSLHRKHIDVTSQVNPCAISKESNHLEQGAGVPCEVNALRSSSVVVKESNYLQQGAELSNRENDDGRIAQLLEAGGMDVNEISCENVNDTVARKHVGKKKVRKIKHPNAAQASLEAAGAGEHKKMMKRKRSTKTINAVDQNPIMSDTEPVEGFAGGISKIEPQKDVNGIEVGDEGEIGDNHASQDGGQEDMAAARARSGVEHANEVGLMNGVEEKEASHDKKDYAKKKTKKRRVNEEKNSLKPEIEGSDPTSKDLSHTDDVTGSQVSDKCERRNNVSREGGGEPAIATHVKSGEENLIGTATLNSIEEKQALDNKQYNTKKKTKRKQSREVENLLNTETKDSDLASKNLMPAEAIIANQVVDICERGVDKVSSGEGEKAVVAGNGKSDQEHVDGIGLMDHMKEKEASNNNKREASEKCEIGNNNASKEGQEEEIVSGHVKSGVEDVNKIGLMDSMKEKEASNNIHDYAKKKTKKKRHHKESLLNKELKDPDFASKNPLNAEAVTSNQVGDKCERGGIIMSGEEKNETVAATVKSCQDHVDRTGLLDHIKEKETSDNNKRDESERCEIGNNNVSQEGQEEETVAGHVKSGVENVNEIRLIDSIKEKGASINIQDHTKKKTKKKRHHKENKDLKDPDFASKNILNSEDITANQVGDKCVREGIILSEEEGKETVVAASVKSGQEHAVETGSLDHKKEKAKSGIREDRAKKKTKKRRSHEEENLLNTEVAVNAADGKSGNDHGQVLESLDHIKEIREDKVGTDDAMDKKRKKSRRSKKEDLLHVGINHPGSNSGQPFYTRNDTSALDSSVVMAKEGKAETATPISPSTVPRSEIERASIDTNQAHTKANVVNAASSLKPSHEGNTDGSPSQAVAKINAPLGDFKEKAGHHADVLGESESFDSKGSRNMKSGNKHRLGLDGYRFTARKSSNGNNGETINRPEREKSLLDTSNAIFKEDSTGSSEGPHGADNSDASTRTPSDNILSDYSDSDSLEDENMSKRDGGGKNIKKSHSIGAKNLTMGAILRSSSRYKKAKLAVSQSQLDGMDSEPPEFVPDSQANV